MESAPQRNRAVFLDRDGTIAEDVNFCCRVDDFRLLPGVPEALRLLTQHGYKLIVVSNQSGVARGYLTEEDLQQINDHMQGQLNESGVGLEGVYCCIHGPDDDCDCRKPKPGLLVAAAAQHDIDLSKSYMVGDSARDIAAGQAAGCRTVLVTTGPGPYDNIEPEPDFVTDSLLSAAAWITGSP